MDDVQVKLIQDLSDENEKLKAALVEAELKLALTETNYKDTLDTAERLIAECQVSAHAYKEAIAGARESKEKYDEAYKEICLLKKQYKTKFNKKLNKILNKI